MVLLPCFYILPHDMQHIITTDLVRLGLLPPGLLPALLPYWTICTAISLRFSGVRQFLGCPTMCKAHLSMLPYYYSHILEGLLHLLLPAPVSLGTRSDVTCDFPTLCPYVTRRPVLRVRNEQMHLSCSDANVHHCPQSLVPHSKLGL